MTTKAAIKRDLFDLVRHNGSAKSIDSAFGRLMFLGASPSEFRGVRDAGLTDDELREVAEKLVGTPTFEAIFNVLVGERQ